VSRLRFSGAIAGIGSTSGVRVVVGRWDDGPWGRFADVMVETADGHRVLLAPGEQVRRFVAATYTFDEERIEPVSVSASERGPGSTWQVRTPSLSLDLTVGRRPALGVLLRAVPRSLATSPAWCAVTDPVARVVMDGVRTVGSAREGRREYYGATDLRRVVEVRGSFDGVDLGALADVDPPCRFGFSSSPRTPSVTVVVTTVDDAGQTGAQV